MTENGVSINNATNNAVGLAQLLLVLGIMHCWSLVGWEFGSVAVSRMCCYPGFHPPPDTPMLG